MKRKPAKPAPPAPTLSAEQLAELFDVHAKTVKQWARDGCPHAKAGNAYRFEEGAVAHWLEETGRKTTPGRPTDPKPEDLDGDHKYWLARKYRLQCLEAEKKLIDADAVRSRWAGLANLVRTSIETLPSQLVPLALCCGMPTDQAQRLQQQAQELVDAALRKLSQSPDEHS